MYAPGLSDAAADPGAQSSSAGFAVPSSSASALQLQQAQHLIALHTYAVSQTSLQTSAPLTDGGHEIIQAFKAIEEQQAAWVAIINSQSQVLKDHHVSIGQLGQAVKDIKSEGNELSSSCRQKFTSTDAEMQAVRNLIQQGEQVQRHLRRDGKGDQRQGREHGVHLCLHGQRQVGGAHWKGS